MFLLGDQLVTSPSDLRLASTCEFAVLAELDVHLGRSPIPDVDVDPMLARVAGLGTMHEQAELRRLSSEYPGRVRSLPRPEHSLAGYATGMAQTLAALDEADVLSQATLFDGSFVGFADFLERTPHGWRVADAKLARSANVPALLQVGAYAELLREQGVPVAESALLLLGSGDAADYRLTEILPVYRRRRARLDEVLAEHRTGDSPVRWGDGRWVACGRCEICLAQVETHRDVLLVAGMRTSTRHQLRKAGIGTIEELATSSGPVAAIRPARLDRLRAQARLQLAQEAAPDHGVIFEVVDQDPLHRLPNPSPGDVFFDFEGDPLWREPGSATWGLEYLFGLVEVDTGAPVFAAFWAHDRAAEKQALEDFVRYVQERRRRWPALHVYHYAAYEVAALTRLAARHSTCEDAIDGFLREGVFVDLYATVRAAVRVSQRSYSLKKIEPLYMGQRTAQVQKGDDSIIQYHLFQAHRDAGLREPAAQLLAGIAEYNREDCISTWRLRDWLVGLVGPDELGTPDELGAPDELEAPTLALEASGQHTNTARAAQLALESSLRDLVADIPAHARTPEDQAVAMVAASVLYHARESKPQWWRHFDRIRYPIEQWSRDAGVGVVEGDVELVADWTIPPGKRVPRRTWSALVEPLGGSPLDLGSVWALYAADSGVPLPTNHDPAAVHVCTAARVEITDTLDELTSIGRQLQRLTVVENAPGGVEVTTFPVALAPTGPVRTVSIDAALDELATRVRDTHPAMVQCAGIDLLRRRPPRMRAGAALPAVGDGDNRFVDAVTSALHEMNDSYVAVQGPPGTGKTYVGARVIARLVDVGWGIGVTAQSHAAIENVLDAILDAGVPGMQVAKAPQHVSTPRWTALASADRVPGFIAGHRAAGRGFVVGGTAWDLTNEQRVGRGSLDLVVIDEAGQYSLAMTLAVSLAGARLLLLGDPAQLPQVSQGVHAEPIDTSALGWLAGGDPVLSADLGYFLETTWRMHPELTRVVSRLSYAGRLGAREQVTSVRALEGIEPGVHVHLVDHVDNAQWSPEEAAAVVALVRDLLGREWTDPAERDEAGASLGPRPLTAADIIVITPYNAQVGAIRAALRDTDQQKDVLAGIRVGTVDKFQGQEAPVAIISLATSSHSDVPRGIGFVLDRHRLNVALSRGKYAAYLVRSPALADVVPRTPQELLAVGAFLGLDEASVEARAIRPDPTRPRPLLTPRQDRTRRAIAADASANFSSAASPP